MIRLKYIPVIINFLISILLIQACSSSEDRPTETNPGLILNKLYLHQTNVNGDRKWEIKSPEAHYEFNSRLIKAFDPVATIYNENRPTISISSKIITVVNDGELFLLEGDIKLRNLTDKSIEFKGDTLYWKPSLSTIGFVGATLFTQYSNEKTNNDVNLRLTSYDPMLELRSGNFKGKGPVSGFDGPINDLRTLKANSLIGNVNKGFVDLINCEVNYPEEMISKASNCSLVWSKRKAGGSIVYDLKTERDITQASESEPQLKVNSNRIYLNSEDSRVQTRVLLK